MIITFQVTRRGRRGTNYRTKNSINAIPHHVAGLPRPPDQQIHQQDDRGEEVAPDDCFALHGVLLKGPKPPG